MLDITIDNIRTVQNLPAAQSCGLIDFDVVQINGGVVNDTFFLIVSGTKPWLTMEIRLQPLIYIDRPEYWGIEVVACQSGLGLPTTAPYIAIMELGSARGTKGIEVIGATKREKRDV